MWKNLAKCLRHRHPFCFPYYRWHHYDLLWLLFLFLLSPVTPDALGEGLWVSRRSRRSLGGSLVSLSILIENAPTNGAQFGLRPWLRQSLRDCSYLWVVNHAAGWMALWKASYPSCLELLNMKAHYNNNDCFDISNCLRWGGHQTSLNEVESLCDAAGTRSARPIGFHRSCPPDNAGARWRGTPGRIQSWAPVFIPLLTTGEALPSESQHLSQNKTPLHGYYIVIIIIYVALYSLKHSIKPIFSSNPQNKPVRTE